MKAVYVIDKEKTQVREIEKPIIKADEVLIKTKTAGICGSDLHLFRGTHPFRHAPAILGHEISGDVVEVGSNVTKFKVGDRVTVEPQVGCNDCEMCAKGYVSLCGHKSVPGTPNWIGTFAEYFNAKEDIVYKLNDDVSYPVGSLTEPLAVAVHAVNHAQTKNGCMVILGGGTIGQMILTVAKHKGFEKIILTDIAPFNRNFALKHGAYAVLDPLSQDVPAEVKNLTEGRGADLVMVAAAAPNIFDQACQCLHKCGEMGLVAMITKTIPFYSYAIVFNELRTYGAMCYEPKDFKEAMDMINGGLDLSDYITHQMKGLEETQQGLDILSQKKEDVVKVVVNLD